MHACLTNSYDTGAGLFDSRSSTLCLGVSGSDRRTLSITVARRFHDDENNCGSRAYSQWLSTRRKYLRNPPGTTTLKPSAPSSITATGNIPNSRQSLKILRLAPALTTPTMVTGATSGAERHVVSVDMKRSVQDLQKSPVTSGCHAYIIRAVRQVFLDRYGRCVCPIVSDDYEPSA